MYRWLCLYAHQFFCDSEYLQWQGIFIFSGPLRLPAGSHCRELNQPAEETNTPSLIWHHSPEWSARYLVAGFCVGLILSGMYTYTRYGLAFSTHNVSAKSTICGYTKCLLYHHSILYHTIAGSIVSDQVTHFTANKGHYEILTLMDSLGSVFPNILKQLLKRVVE